MELINQINRFGKDIYSKTRDTGEIVRLNTMINEQERTLDRLYRTLGQNVYEDSDFKEVLVSVYPEACEAISSSLGLIKEYQERIKDLKGLERCSACGTDNPREAVFCSGCGRRLAEEQNVQEEKKTCPACGAEITFSEALFCTSCGAKLPSRMGTESEG